jgi:hypothetical protein
VLQYPGSRTESPNQKKWRRAEADEEAAVAKNVEAFRAGRIATDAKALHLLCAPELATATPMAASNTSQLLLRTQPAEDRNFCP